MAPARAVPGANLAQACRDIAALFREAGIDTPELDARLLVCHCCDLSHEQLAANPRRPLDDREASDLESCAARRLAREPVSRIVGRREFHGLDFALGPTTLDPRGDTEVLVDAAIELARGGSNKDGVRVLDLGTGSGCILVSLLHALPAARGTGTDICATALSVARRNAAFHDVSPRASFTYTRWVQDVTGSFDFVVSNPPYIPSAEIESLQPEVSLYDPHDALDGGSDGLEAFREIVMSVERVLRPGGWLLFEVGAGQHDAVLGMLGSEHAGCTFGEVRTWRDLSRTVRCVGGKRSPTTK